MVVNILRMFDTRMHMKKKDPANLKEVELINGGFYYV